MTATQGPTRAAAPRRSAAPDTRTVSRPAPLRIVRAGELSPQGRRRRRRLIVVSSVALVVLTLFGVVVEHAILAQQQFRLAYLQSRAAAERAQNQSLQLQVARLQSPSRIVSTAQSRYGMVVPAGLTYLAPGHQGPKVQGQAASASASTHHSTTVGSGGAQAASPPSTRP